MMWFVRLFSLLVLWFIPFTAPPVWTQAAPSGDIAVRINETFKQCTNDAKSCSYQLDAGEYTQLSSINVPCPKAYGKITLRGVGAATVLNFSGEGDAIAALCPGVFSLDLTVADLQIVLSPNARSGVHLRGFSRAALQNVRIRDGVNADAIFIEGANTVTITNPNLVGNRNGIHNVGYKVGDDRYSANAIKVYGGLIDANRRCGLFEDGALASAVGANIGNGYEGIVFEDNGTNGDPKTGNLCIQQLYAGVFTNNYFEYDCKLRVPFSAWIGDEDHSPHGLVLRANAWLSCGSQATINLENAEATSIAANSELGKLPTFILHGKRAKYTRLYPNSFNAVESAKNKKPKIPGLTGSAETLIAIPEVLP